MRRPEDAEQRQTGGAEHPEAVIAAAGRLVPGKRFDLLIEAFSTVAAKHPEARLRIYGGGPEKQRLHQLSEGLGLGSRVRLMGTRSPIEAEFARASLVASSSDAESFGMTLVEAMRCGVPVISTDCPLGPAEIIHDGIDGFLVPRDDAAALAGRMLTLIENEPRRQAMAQAALVSAHRYDPERVVEQYIHLFGELHGTRLRRALRRSRWYAAARETARRTVRHTARRATRPWKRCRAARLLAVHQGRLMHRAPW
ncbi:glycosyltransferase [Streptomyces axinellae]